MPKISVLLPTYNYARYLPLAIESVLAQDFPDFELIISDDASRDESAAIAGLYAARDARIRFHRHETNLGMVGNWNWCLRQARGTYVKFLFGDDALATPDALRTLAGLLDAHPTAAFAGSARALLDAASRQTGLWDDLEPGLHAGPALAIRCLRRRRNLIGEPTSVLLRRAPADRGFDPAYRQIVDLEMWFHLLLQGDFVYTARPLCAFRRHEGQQTVANNRERVTDQEMVNLLDRYVASARLGTHLTSGSLAHRQIIFRQVYYMRKARATQPDSLRVLQQLRRQLPLPWYSLCWVWHRLARPLENLHRKLGIWSYHLGLRRRPSHPAGNGTFLASLPTATGADGDTPPGSPSA